MAGFKNLVGGELKGYTELLSEARDQAMERLQSQAAQLGANAIVNIRFSTSSVAAGASTSSKRPVGEIQPSKPAELAFGSVVVSIDYFKRIAATLRQFFGGRVTAYETLVDRGRREAILRLKESCPNAKQIINIRIETSSIYKGQGNQVGSIEVLAYGTAIY